MTDPRLEEIFADLAERAGPPSQSEKGRSGALRVPELRRIAQKVGKAHDLALRLWDAGGREARILAAMVAEPARTDEDLMDRWAAGFDTWEICDQVCMNLFEKTPYAWGKAIAWADREEPLVKRAAFVLMARLAVTDKAAPDGRFEAFFPLIRREAGDGRNYVKKALSWALRQIGKRNTNLHARAADEAGRLLGSEEKNARWVAADALRELTGDAVSQRMR